MTKGVHIDEILQALPRRQRADFVDKLKRGGGVSLTVARSYGKRKHRWDSAEGKVVAIRLTDAEFQIVSGRAAAKKLSPGLYLKSLSLDGDTRLAMSGRVYAYWKNKADKWCVSVTAYIEAYLEHEANRNHHLSRQRIALPEKGGQHGKRTKLGTPLLPS